MRKDTPYSHIDAYINIGLKRPNSRPIRKSTRPILDCKSPDYKFENAASNNSSSKSRVTKVQTTYNNCNFTKNSYRNSSNISGNEYNLRAMVDHLDRSKSISASDPKEVRSSICKGLFEILSKFWEIQCIDIKMLILFYTWVQIYLWE